MTCGHSHYKPRIGRGKTLVVYKKLRYFPITPRLQRLFMSPRTAEHRKTYNNGVCVKGSTSSELEVEYYGRLEDVVELQYHNEQNIVFLFKCYWYDTTDMK